MTTPDIRSAIVAEARRWLKTPWHHEARVCGVGVDCGQLLIGVYSAVGLVEEFDVPAYPADWHLHRDETRFLDQLLEHADPVDQPLPGDICMFQYGRHAAHGSIVVEWPLIIHAWRDEGMVVLSNVEHGPLEERVAGFYRMKGVE